MAWDVVLHPEAAVERSKLPAPERAAINQVIRQLTVNGPTLGYPHSSNIQGADKLRELRPRRGRSPWRAFYRRAGDTFVIAAIGPEAQVNPREFKRAVKAAEQRLAEVEGS